MARSSSRPAIDALGLALRPAHLAELSRAEEVPVGFFEILAENYLGPAELPRLRAVEAIRGAPVVAHGVSLDLLGCSPIDEDHIARLRELISFFGSPWLTDHLCWCTSRGVSHHELLPAPLSRDLVPYAAQRAREIQDRLGVPLGLENVSSYVGFARDEMPEWAFVRQVLSLSGCHLLLDVNNVAVSAHNAGFDPIDYLEGVDWDKVLYVHIAGHSVLESGLRHDTHDRAPSSEVLALYRAAWSMGGPFPTLLEWDDQIPPLEEALAALERCDEARR